MHWRHPAAIFEVKRWRNNQNEHRLANEQPPFDLKARVPYWNDVMCIRSIPPWSSHGLAIDYGPVCKPMLAYQCPFQLD